MEENIGNIRASKRTLLKSAVESDQQDTTEELLFTENMLRGFLLAKASRNYRAMEIYGELYYEMNKEVDIEKSLLILCEAYFANEKFQKTLYFMQKHLSDDNLSKNPYLITLKAKSLLNMGGDNILFCVQFLENLKPMLFQKYDHRFAPVKYLLGKVYEMNDRNHEAIEIYKLLCIEKPSVNVMAIKKVFSYGALTPNEELQLFKQMTFDKCDRWVMHLTAGFISSFRRSNPEMILDRKIRKHEKAETNICNDTFFFPYKNVPNVILFETGTIKYTAKDTCRIIEETYPTFALPKVLRFSNINLAIITKQKFYSKNYVDAYCVSKILVETTVKESVDVLPIHILCAIQLGLFLEVLAISQRLRESTLNENFTFFSDGCFFLMKSEYERAAKSFRYATDRCREVYSDLYVASQICLGHSLSLGNAHDQAIREYLVASRIYRGSFEVFLFLGMEYEKIACYGDSCTNLKIAKELAPDIPQVYHELGILALQLHQYAEAVKHLERAVTLSKRLDTFLFLCDSYQNMLGKAYLCSILNGQYCVEEFEDILKKAIAVLLDGYNLNPQNADILAYLSCCYYILGQQQLAVDFVIKVKI